MPEVLLRPPEVIARCGISRSKLFALISAGEFPKPIKVTSRTTAFIEKEVDEWIHDRINESRGEAGDHNIKEDHYA